MPTVRGGFFASSKAAPHVLYEIAGTGQHGVIKLANGGRFSRHVRVLHALQSARRGLTVKELIELLDDVSPRTIYRYLNELRRDGFGVEAADGRWYARATSYVPVQLLDSEVLALSVALDLLPGGLRAELSPLAEKLGATLSPTKRAFLAQLRGQQRTSSPGGTKEAPVSHVRDAVQQALAQEVVLRITYRSPDGTVTVRDIEVRGALHHPGGEHVVAWCRTRQSVRQFSLVRILSAELLDQAFETDPNFDIDEYAKHAFSVRSGEPMAVVIDLHRDIAYLADERVWHPSQRVTPAADGGVRVSFEASGLYEIAAWAAGLGGLGIVRGPPELAERVRMLHVSGLSSMKPQLSDPDNCQG